MTLSDLKPLHDAGFSLLFLHKQDKRPLENSWTTTPSKTWKELKNAFHPTYNIGVRLGVHSQLEHGFLCCIDVDIKEAAYRDVALQRLKEITGGKIYPEVRSGSGNGSRHLYAYSKKPFKMIQIEKRKGEWEICAYSTGRQMVLPPSIHPNGKPYIWYKPFNPLTLPEFDPAQWGDKKKTEKEIVSAGGFKAVDVNLGKIKHLASHHIDTIRDGADGEDRSAKLMSLAMAMCRAQMTDDEILSVLSDPKNKISECAYDHTGSKNRARAVNWIRKYTLEGARYETDIMRRFENKPALQPLPKREAEALSLDLVDEARLAPLDRDSNGKPKPTLKNVIQVLEGYMGGGLVGFDEFANRAYFLKDTKYGGRKNQEITDHHDLNLKHYLACHYGFEPSKEICYEAHSLIARKHAYHPVRDFLTHLEWDGTKRLDGWLKSAFRASGPEDYLNAVSRKILVAAITRVFDPGCKFDYVMVLEGFQGKGKSSALAMLSGAKWFTDGLGDIHTKDVVDQMTGKWIIEMAELASIKKSDIDMMKAFITRQVDRVRPPYGRRSEDFPRQSIFIGSTNNSEYFTDETGNRRFWPVTVRGIDRTWIEKNRDQLWAEAMMRYRLGEDIYLSKDLEAVANREQEKRFLVDEWEKEIKKIVSKMKPDEKITSTHIWRAIYVNDGGGHPSTAETMRIGRIMIRLGFLRKTLRIDGVLAKCWVRNYLKREV